MTKREQTDKYFKMPHKIVFEPCEEGGYFVSIPDLPNCMTQSETIEEAGRMILDAKRVWIESALEDGMPIPEPSKTPQPSQSEKERAREIAEDYRPHFTNKNNADSLFEDIASALAEQREEHPKQRQFLEWLFDEVFEGSPDGGDIQSKAEELGILVPCKVDRTNEKYKDYCDDYDTDELLFPFWTEEAKDAIRKGERG